ncbi:MAG: hypothetical protein LBP87_05125, partial [Planctomycetaceae bacterium]|nr:hypothetical protein [Planctomycetaceae bacterium]
VSIGLPVPIKNELVVKINNPSGQPLSGEQLTLKQIEGIDITETIKDWELKRGETEKRLIFPLKSMPKEKYKFSVSATTCSDLFPLRTMKLIDDFSSLNNEILHSAWAIYSDGDTKVGSEQKIEAVDGMVKITYKFDEGWKFVRLEPKGERGKIEGKPNALGVRIDSNDSYNSVHLRYADSKGQTFQVYGGRLKGKTSNYFEFALNGSNAIHWGGPNDGKITYPLRVDSIIIDGTRKACGPYSILVSSPVLIYE